MHVLSTYILDLALEIHMYMYMYVCMFVSMHKCIREYIYTSMQIFLYLFVSAYDLDIKRVERYIIMGVHNC